MESKSSPPDVAKGMAAGPWNWAEGNCGWVLKVLAAISDQGGEREERLLDNNFSVIYS